MKKLLLVLLIIAAAAFMMSGCAEITYGFYVNADESVTIEYTVELDTEADYAPYNIDYAFDVAEAQLEGMLDDNPEYGDIVYYDDEPYKVSLIYSFESLNEYYHANGITGDEEPEPDDGVTEKGLLFDTYTFSTFDDIDSFSAIIYADNMRIAAFPAYPYVDYDEITLTLKYGTKYEKAYTANSDESEVDDNGTTVFIWHYSLDDCDGPRLLTVTQPNFMVWYSAAIVFSIVFTTILVIIIKAGKKKDGRDKVSV